ncbi:hypothetical protein [Domibacillus robiginosus]|uniref:hypothetical protein n=1 Tax=Domibacillus robiginosus TaxID=1071054 RepID=UPI00067E1079|nr:hypothetical protein [Domibacillus robiginosus]
MDKKTDYQELSNVQDQLTLIPEEFPDGAYGQPIDNEKAVEGKSTPWKENQHVASGFTYEFKQLHENRSRQYPGAHPTHDEK